jgi:hypothetical protein
MRNDLFAKIIKFVTVISKHQGCEDGFYACPKHPDYFGQYDNISIEERPCFCYGEDAEELLKELEHPL